MSTLAKLIGCGWLGLVFYGIGSLNSGRQLAIAGLVLLAGCALSAAIGYGSARRRLVTSRAGAAATARSTARR